MKIRKAKEGDIDKMLAIVKINSSKYPSDVARKEFEEMFSDSLLKPTYLVVELENEVVGFGGFARSWIDNNVVNIFWINVKSEFQGRGVGGELMKGLISEIENLGEPKVKLMMLSTDKSEFYEKFGFERMGSEYDGDYVLMGRVVG